MTIHSVQNIGIRKLVPNLLDKKHVDGKCVHHVMLNDTELLVDYCMLLNQCGTTGIRLYIATKWLNLLFKRN